MPAGLVPVPEAGFSQGAVGISWWSAVVSRGVVRLRGSVGALGDGDASLSQKITFRVDGGPLTELGGELAASVEPLGGVLGQRC